MKVIWTLNILLFWQGLALGQDLPNPPANLQTMPQDSYVIAMDNQWQATTGTNPSYRLFNLKSYGLVTFLLNNNIKVRRVIRSGKAKDGVDFSASCQQVKPTMESWPQLRDFRAGPFVIFGSDVVRVNIEQLIDYYNNNANGISGITHDTAKVRVYKTTADVTVNVRYNMTGFKPKAAILNDGGFASVHLKYYSLAGIPATNYIQGTNSDLDISCFTFASEPHNGLQNSTVANNIRNFVLAGGNFLAQCATTITYESLVRFQSTNGIENVPPPTTPPPTHFLNADLNMVQFEGPFSISQGGYRHWRYNNSAFANNAHVFLTNTTSYIHGSSLIGASASKLTSPSVPGGMVYYLGNHSYDRIDNYNHINGIRMYLNAFLTPSNVKSILRYSYNADCNANAMQVASYNGPSLAYPVNFYLYADKGTIMGAVDPGDPFIGATSVYSPGTQAYISLMGSDPAADYVMRVEPSASCYKPEQVSPTSCRMITLPALLKNFTAKRHSNQVLLRWHTLTEQGNEGFYIQRLVNNVWMDAGFVPSAAPDGNSNSKLQYQFEADVFLSGTTHFRIRMQSLAGAVHYSDIRMVQAANNTTLFSLYPNPSATGSVELTFAGAGVRSVVLYDVAGRTLRQYEKVTDATFHFAGLKTGVYLIKVADAAGNRQLQKLVVQ